MNDAEKDGLDVGSNVLVSVCDEDIESLAMILSGYIPEGSWWRTALGKKAMAALKP